MPTIISMALLRPPTLSRAFTRWCIAMAIASTSSLLLGSWSTVQPVSRTLVLVARKNSVETDNESTRRKGTNMRLDVNLETQQGKPRGSTNPEIRREVQWETYSKWPQDLLRQQTTTESHTLTIFLPLSLTVTKATTCPNYVTNNDTLYFHA